MTPHELERYSFYWSELRLLIAAVALFIGGVPPLILLLPIPGTVWLLKLFWIISGAVSLYLFYRYVEHKQTLFGHHDRWDMAAFYVNLISGLNLGIAGLFNINIGMTITHNYTLFFIVGLIYLASAYRLYIRYQAHGHHLF